MCVVSLRYCEVLRFVDLNPRKPDIHVTNGLIYNLFQLVSNALQFLSSVADRAHYRNLFEDNNVLNSICEKVIIPNMEFRRKHLLLHLIHTVNNFVLFSNLKQEQKIVI